MIDYKRWKMLNESLGFPLALKTPQAVAIAGLGFNLDERKGGKKKMDGELGDDADVDTSDMDDSDDDSDDSDDDQGCSCKDKKKPKLPVPKDKVAPDSGDGEDAVRMAPGDDKMMMKKKGMKKKMQAETSFLQKLDQDYNITFNDPELGTEEYSKEFEASLARQYGEPGRRFSNGIPVEEDVLLDSPNVEPSREPSVDTNSTPRLGPTWDAYWSKILDQ